MFTGIIEETGKILSIQNHKISISAKLILDDIKNGDSIAVSGICLTVTNVGKDFFDADVSPETFKVTTLSSLKAGQNVNLERAMSANGRFGGHIVSGHIDCTGRVTNLRKDNDFYTLEFEIPNEYSKYTVKKGSICVNGISLTIAEISADRFSIAIIPHTFENTNLKDLHIGDYVNIETDILARYVEKFLSTSDNRTGISMEFLQLNGF